MSIDHYADRYWNDLPAVVAHLQELSTGNRHLWWIPYVKQRYAPEPIERVLVIGCGSGWVDRDLIDSGVAASIDAFDASPDYLAQAVAARGDRRIMYRQCTFEDFRAEGQYDLIVNVAALHHARYLWHHSRELAAALAPDGIFVNWEYVGPSRNQYFRPQMRELERVNAALPERYRSPRALRPPLEATMRTDPTEAVHSAGIPEVLRTLFEPVEWREMGGGLAYPILWNNIAVFEDETDAEAAGVLEGLLRTDIEATRAGRVPNMFLFAVVRRRAAPNRALVRRRLLTERAREAAAARCGARYPIELARDGYRAVLRPFINLITKAEC